MAALREPLSLMRWLRSLLSITPRVRRIACFAVIAIIGIISTLILVSVLISFVKDEIAKATVLAGAITLFGIIYTAMYNEISAYNKDRSEIICKKWNLIFPFIKSDYYPWINSARSFRGSLDRLNPNKLSNEEVTRVLYLIMVFFGYRLRLILNNGGLILLSTDDEEKKVMSLYRQIENASPWAGDETPRRVSYLQHLFLSRNKRHDPYVLAQFAEDLEKDQNVKDSRDKLKAWLTEPNIEGLKKALKDFSDAFKASVDNLYSAWSE